MVGLRRVVSRRFLLTLLSIAGRSEADDDVLGFERGKRTPHDGGRVLRMNEVVGVGVDVVEEEGEGDSFKRRRRSATMASSEIAARNHSSFIVIREEGGGGERK